jgi:hypothetical protein
LSNEELNDSKLVILALLADIDVATLALNPLSIEPVIFANCVYTFPKDADTDELNVIISLFVSAIEVEIEALNCIKSFVISAIEFEIEELNPTKLVVCNKST